MAIEFKALVVTEIEKGKFQKDIKTRSINDLPDGDVLIKVQYSSLNYKDALSASGHKGITRNYPHTPGIDAAGVVEESSVGKFKKGERVLVTGYDLGMNTSGGFGEYIRVPEDWVVKIPNALSNLEAMELGTAGFTAAVAVYEIIFHGIKPNDGYILVTGASGGVGSISIKLLNNLNYKVVAATRKLEEEEYLKNLGADKVIHLDEIRDTQNKALLKKQWKAAIDNVGGLTLTSALKGCDYHGVVCCIGNVESSELNTNIFPFILRGVKLVGIDSASRPMELRELLWNNLANKWKLTFPENTFKIVDLNGLNDEISKILDGKQKGRVILQHY